jgi:hypothetical protein
MGGGHVVSHCTECDQRGIVLDETTAPLVPDGSTLDLGPGDIFMTQAPDFTADPGDILSHIGGRPVAELVAAHDRAKADAEALRGYAEGTRWWRADSSQTFDVIADHLDYLADLIITPELVAAWNAQHDGTPS